MDNFWKFATVALAVLALYITFHQFWLAKEKLRLDLFETRFAVFAGVRLFLSKISQVAAVTMDDVWKFRSDVAEASFVFDDDVTDLIDQIDKRAVEAWAAHEQMKELDPGPERTDLANRLRGLTWSGSRHSFRC
jgi:hypothetical protein